MNNIIYFLLLDEIIWHGDNDVTKFKKPTEESEMVDWGLESTGNEISAYKYTCDFKLDHDKSPIFKYRQNWKDWGYSKNL